MKISDTRVMLLSDRDPIDDDILPLQYQYWLNEKTNELFKFDNGWISVNEKWLEELERRMQETADRFRR